jgi:predicted dinucleotide-binding enzyme
MRIGFIGTGNIGGTLAKRLGEAGHEVMVSNSRGPETLADVVAELGPKAQAGTAAEAAAFGDVVIVAIPFGRYGELPKDELDGKIVVDADNYYAGRDGDFPDGEHTSSSAVAHFLTGSRVVKAFNTMQWTNLRDRGRPAGDPERVALPLAGDDAEAKKVVAALIDELGFDPVDAGDLDSTASRMEPGTPVYGALLGAKEIRHALGL